MILFTILGVVWVAIMAVRVPTLKNECKLFVKIFQASAGYTKLQAYWVTASNVFIPGLLMAPALVVLDRAAFVDPPSPDQIYDTAKHIDSVLKQRAEGK